MEINLIKAFILKDTYIFYIDVKLYLLFYKGYLLLRKYVNELFHFIFLTLYLISIFA